MNYSTNKTQSVNTRFSEHLKKVSLWPSKKPIPVIIKRSIERFDTLFTHDRLCWDTGAAQKLTFRLYRYHTPDAEKERSKERKRRFQACHSLKEVMAYLLFRTNVRASNRYLSYLEISQTSIDDIVRGTGFARATVNDALSLAESLGFLRTRRNKHENIDIQGVKTYREKIATRWLTEQFFSFLGISKRWLDRYKHGQKEEQRKTYYSPVNQSSAAYQDYTPIQSTNPATNEHLKNVWSVLNKRRIVNDTS